MESRIVQEISEIPVICSFVRFWKKNYVLSFSVKIVTHGVEYVDEKLTGTAIDDFVGQKISHIKDNYPLMMSSPEKIARKTSSRSTKFIKKKTRAIMNNPVGRAMIFGLEILTAAAEGTVHLIEGPKRPSTPGVFTRETSEKHVQTDTFEYAVSKATKEQQTTLSGSQHQWADRIADDVDRGIMYLFTKVLLFPLLLTINVLHKIRDFVKPRSLTSVGSRRKSTRKIKTKPLSPEQLRQIAERRKVSPKKRLHPTFLGSIKSSALRILGLESRLSSERQTDIRQFLTCSKLKELNESSVTSKSERKRKHPDVTDESESESESDNDLQTMNLENYLSEEDPDYDPSDDIDESDDSSIMTSDEEEEVVEVEDAGNELVQLKDDKPLQLPTKEKKKSVNEDKADAKNEKNKQSTCPSKVSSPRPHFLSPKVQHAPSSPKGLSSLQSEATKISQSSTPSRTNQTEQKTDPKSVKPEKNEKSTPKDETGRADIKSKTKETKDVIKDVLKEQSLNKENLQKSSSKDEKIPSKKI